jgi:hypothetical protein
MQSSDKDNILLSKGHILLKILYLLLFIPPLKIKKKDPKPVIFWSDYLNSRLSKIIGLDQTDKKSKYPYL